MPLKNIDKDYALKILMAGINVEDKESLKQGLQELIEGVDWNENDETSPAFIKNRPFYDKSLVSVPHYEISRIAWYKVSDDVPTGHPAVNDEVCIILDGSKMNGYILFSNDEYYVASETMVVVALKDNAVISEFNNLTFPEKGTYFIAGEVLPSITGFALGKDADPEITWDGDLGTLKTLDEKYIPKIPYKKLPYITETTPGIVDKNTFSEYAPIKVLYKYNNITGLASQIKSPFVFVDMDTGSSISSKCYFVYPQMQGIQIMPNTPNKEQSYVSAFSFDGYKCILVFYRTNTTIDRWYFESVKNINEVILPSTTESSTKKFRITVDDSGTISATEITG